MVLSGMVMDTVSALQLVAVCVVGVFLKYAVSGLYKSIDRLETKIDFKFEGFTKTLSEFGQRLARVEALIPGRHQ